MIELVIEKNKFLNPEYVNTKAIYNLKLKEDIKKKIPSTFQKFPAILQTNIIKKREELQREHRNFINRENI